MAFMNFSGFFYARNDLRLFKIEKKNELKSFFYKDYTLSSYKFSDGSDQSWLAF